MLAWVGADGGPHGFDRFDARAQHEGYPVGAQEGPRSFICLLFSPSSCFCADADRERFCIVASFLFVQLSPYRFSMSVVRVSAVCQSLFAECSGCVLPPAA
jgi:hypothetical protein